MSHRALAVRAPVPGLLARLLHRLLRLISSLFGRASSSAGPTVMDGIGSEPGGGSQSWPDPPPPPPRA